MGNEQSAVEFQDPATLDPDSKEFAALLNVPDPDSAETAPPEQDVTGASSGAETETGSAATTDPVVEEPAGVLSKDESNIIPYSVLEETRKSESAAKAQLDQAERQIAELNQRIEEAGRVAETTETTETTEAAESNVSEIIADVNTLKEDFPEFGKVAEKLLSTIDNLSGQVTSLTESRDQQIHEIRTKNTALAQTEIDNNPSLSLWQNEDQSAYDRAFEHDSRLKQDPLYVDKPLKERFEKVVEMVRLEYPEAKQPTGTKVKESDESISAKAAAALRNAGDVDPETLSGVPGGMVPETAESPADLSMTALEELFEGKSQEWQDEWLSKHAQ
jgi:TolA-binding protein